MGERRPLGIPISRAILLPPGPLGDVLRPAFEAVDRVHGAGPLPQLAVMPDPELDADAAYEVIRATREPFRLTINPSGRQLALSLLHEIAHFLVHAGLGRLLRERRIGMVAGIPIPIQWSRVDFEPIADAIDELLRGVGWLG
jgi:hypothetical protein